MTAQFPDTFLFRGRGYAPASLKGSALFDPLSVGLGPASCSTRCWRGHVFRYGLKEGSLVLAALGPSMLVSPA